MTDAIQERNARWAEQGYFGNGGGGRQNWGGNNNRDNGNGGVGGVILTGLESYAAAKGAGFLANALGGNVSFGIPNSSGGRTFVSARPDQPNYGQPYGYGNHGYNDGGRGGVYNGSYPAQIDANRVFRDMVKDLGQAADVDSKNPEKAARKAYEQGAEFTQKFLALAPTGILTLDHPMFGRANGHEIVIQPGPYTAAGFANVVLQQAGVESNGTSDAVADAIRNTHELRGLLRKDATQQAPAAQAAQATPELMTLLQKAAVRGDAKAAEEFTFKFNALRDIDTNTVNIPETPMKDAAGKETKIPAGTYDMSELAARAEAIANNAAGKAALDAAIAANEETFHTSKRKGNAPAAPAAPAAETAPAATPPVTGEEKPRVKLWARKDGTPAPAADVVAKIDTDEKVKALQAALGVEPADGLYGPQTQAAIEDYAAKLNPVKKANELDFTGMDVATITKTVTEAKAAAAAAAATATTANAPAAPAPEAPAPANPAPTGTAPAAAATVDAPAAPRVIGESTERHNFLEEVAKELKFAKGDDASYIKELEARAPTLGVKVNNDGQLDTNEIREAGAKILTGENQEAYKNNSPQLVASMKALLDKEGITLNGVTGGTTQQGGPAAPLPVTTGVDVTADVGRA